MDQPRFPVGGRVQCKLSGYPVGKVKKIICPGENKNNRGFEYVIEFVDKQDEIVMDKNLWPINENSLESQSDESESDYSSEDPAEEDHLIRGTVEEEAQKEKKTEKIVIFDPSAKSRVFQTSQLFSPRGAAELAK